MAVQGTKSKNLSQCNENVMKKKRKTAHMMNGWIEDSPYLPGSIVRIKVTNFLTYDECDCSPGPNLNVILGPNGSGKSSIVCAICLGLAGSPKLLGRAENVGEFVKHGETHGSIELELFGDSGTNYIIRRNITRDNKSTWFLNKKTVTQKNIQDLVMQLDIQITNLCQFLPQEKVVEFAKMSPQELLVATEKAVGPCDMWQNHQDLISLGKKGKDLETSLNSEKEHLEKLQEQNSRLEHEVRRFQERERHLEKIKMLEKKRPWAEYEELRKKFVEIKTQRDELKKVLDKEKEKNAPLENRKATVTKKEQEHTENERHLNEKGRQSYQSCKKKKDKLDEWLDKVKDKENELKGITDQQKRLHKKIGELEKIVESLKEQLESLPTPETFQPRLLEIGQSARAINQTIQKIQTDANNIRAERSPLSGQLKNVRDRIAMMEDMRNQRLEQLRKREKDTYNAVMWLRENKHKFEKTVHEPIMLLVNMHKKEHAKYIESVVSANDMKSFVCESRKDLQLFLSEVRDKQSLRINAVAPPETPLEMYKPRLTNDQIKQWGFHRYLNQLFTAPEAVMKYLCQNCRIHNIPLGSEWTKNHADEVIQRSGFRHFYTTNSKFIIRTSRYGNRTNSTMVTKVREARFFNISVDMELKRRLEIEKQNIEKTIGEGDERFKQLQSVENTERSKLEKLRNEKKELQEKQGKYKSVTNQIQSKLKSIEIKKNEMPDIEKEEERIGKDIKKLNNERVEIAFKLKTDLTKCMEMAKERVVVSINLAHVKLEKANIEDKIRESSHALQELENEFNEVKKSYDTVRHKAKQQLKVAHRATDTPDGAELSAQLKELFKLYPNAVDEIDEMIHSEKAKADCNYQTNPQVIREYERRKLEIADLEAKIGNCSIELDQRNNQVENLKEKWLKPLNELLRKINEKFVGFFRKLQCAGEVSLATDQGEENYEKYGVQIKVKFRAKDSLHVLTQHHQSGGEKSVSTILYLMSLQELTRCPFRVVDEINQGMDPNNERKVFELMVETATRPNTSQYFLMSPKLLPGLSYSDNMTILFVYNGYWMLKSDLWNTKNLVKKLKDIASL